MPFNVPIESVEGRKDVEAHVRMAKAGMAVHYQRDGADVAVMISAEVFAAIESLVGGFLRLPVSAFDVELEPMPPGSDVYRHDPIGGSSVRATSLSG